jgi:hypothetical protein
MIAEAVGLGAAVDYLGALGMERVRAHERALTPTRSSAWRVPGLRLFGPPSAERRGGVVSFAIEGMHPHDIAELLGRGGTSASARPPLRAAADALPRRRATARASFGVYNVPRRRRRAGRRRSQGAEGVCLMDDLYRDFILDHYKRPRNFGELEPHDLEARAQPAVRRRAGGADPRRRRAHRRPALPRPRLRDLPGLGVDRLRGAEGHGRSRRRRRSTPTG